MNDLVRFFMIGILIKSAAVAFFLFIEGFTGLITGGALLLLGLSLQIFAFLSARREQKALERAWSATHRNLAPRRFI